MQEWSSENAYVGVAGLAGGGLKAAGDALTGKVKEPPHKFVGIEEMSRNIQTGIGGGGHEPKMEKLGQDTINAIRELGPMIGQIIRGESSPHPKVK